VYATDPSPLPRPASTAIHESSAVAVHAHALVTVAPKLPPDGGAACEPGSIVRSHEADDGGTPSAPHAVSRKKTPARRTPADVRFMKRSNYQRYPGGMNRRYGGQRPRGADRTGAQAVVSAFRFGAVSEEAVTARAPA